MTQNESLDMSIVHINKNLLKNWLRKRKHFNINQRNSFQKFAKEMSEESNKLNINIKTQTDASKNK